MKTRRISVGDKIFYFGRSGRRVWVSGVRYFKSRTFETVRIAKSVMARGQLI